VFGCRPLWRADAGRQDIKEAKLTQSVEVTLGGREIHENQFTDTAFSQNYAPYDAVLQAAFMYHHKRLPFSAGSV